MFKKVFPLTSIVVLRFFALFIVLPVISLYANSFESSTPFWIGLAVSGSYLTQLIFQTPFGILSDKYNRKFIVGIGFFIFLVGSLICAQAQSIQMLVLGRLIQGIGAIGGVVSAQISDLVREEERTKAMAIMGGGIFLSFILSMILSPLIAANVGINWLFYLTAIFNFACLIVLFTLVPDSPKLNSQFSASKSPEKSAMELQNTKNIWLMNLSSFLEKMLMTLTFVIIPLALVDHFSFAKSDLWKVYLPSALLGVVALAPASILAEKKNRPKLVMILGIVFFLLAYAIIAAASSQAALGLFVFGILLFFIGFSTLEPIMQSLASKYAKAHLRGLVLGNFTTVSYAGSFVGGMFGAYLYHHFSLAILSSGIVLICVLWLISIFFIDNPQDSKNLYLPYTQELEEALSGIAALHGVVETYIETYASENEKCIIIKYNAKIISKEALEKIIHQETQHGN